MKSIISRTPEQLRHHYEVEKELANRLRSASRVDRRKLYGVVYDELYARISDHPLLQRKSLPPDVAKDLKTVKTQMSFLRGFVNRDVTFLEIGSGSGLISMEVAQIVKNVIAVDVSQEISSRSNLPKNLEVRLFNGVEIPAEPASVDVAYSHQVMEHIHIDDAKDQIKSVHNVLAEGGVYVCVVPNRLSGPHDISRYFDQVATGFHMKEYTTSELRALFRSAGFTRTSSYVGAKGYYCRVPQSLLIFIEAIVESVPFAIRSRVTRKPPLRPLLEIRMAAWK